VVPVALSSFNILSLSFAPPFPLALFFPPTVLTSYSAIFRFLFSLKKIRDDLSVAWLEKGRCLAKYAPTKAKSENQSQWAMELALHRRMMKQLWSTYSIISFFVTHISLFFSEDVVNATCQSMAQQMFPDSAARAKQKSVAHFDPHSTARSSSLTATASSSASASPFSSSSLPLPSLAPHPSHDTSFTPSDFLSVVHAHERGLLQIQAQLFLTTPVVAQRIQDLLDVTHKFIDLLSSIDERDFQRRKVPPTTPPPSAPGASATIPFGLLPSRPPAAAASPASPTIVAMQLLITRLPPLRERFSLSLVLLYKILTQIHEGQVSTQSQSVVSDRFHNPHPALSKFLMAINYNGFITRLDSPGGRL
jgi:hypothetical protein